MNNQCFLHPQYLDWGETLEQGTEPPTAPRVPQAAHCSGCVFTTVCVFTAVCVQCGWVKCRTQILGMGPPYLATRHFTFTKLVYVWAAQIILLQTAFWMKDNSRQVLLNS